MKFARRRCITIKYMNFSQAIYYKGVKSSRYDKIIFTENDKFCVRFIAYSYSSIGTMYKRSKILINKINECIKNIKR